MVCVAWRSGRHGACGCQGSDRERDSRTPKDTPPLKVTTWVFLWSAALLFLPAAGLAAPEAAVARQPLDSGSLALLGAGFVVLAISLRARRRS